MKFFFPAVVITGFLIPGTLQAQERGVQTIELRDLSEFKSQAGNWSVVGSVTMHPFRDIHAAHTTTPPEAPVKGKKKKAKPEAPVVTAEPAVEFTSGTGILLNQNDATRKDHLVTNWEHGDLELEFDVMVPKGSNSGVYLQGRYEVQLLDSWQAGQPSFSDIGGIYRNWESEPLKAYAGKAPLLNAAKAPGLWQHFRISFQAPRFNDAGQKIQNARFMYVELNGVRIHENVEVPLPTGGPIENNEKALGPLMIQGDHGPVAFRNFRIKRLQTREVKLTDISWAVFHGDFKAGADLLKATPVLKGQSQGLTCEVLDTDNNYGASYQATLNIPEADEYTLTFAYTGGMEALVDGRSILTKSTPDAWAMEQVNVQLSSGPHKLELLTFKDASWLPPRLGMAIEAPTMYQVFLHEYNSYPLEENPVSQILINTGNQPRLLRAFVDFKGDRNRRLTHTIGVGETNRVNYIFDLARGLVVAGWRGDFVDATPMWHDRGDGSFLPRGYAQFTFIGQPLAMLTTPEATFPIEATAEYQSRGYILDKSGLPEFKAEYGGMKVAHKVRSTDTGLQVVVTLSGAIKPNLYYKFAEGSDIVEIEKGLYSIGGAEYFIKSVEPLQIRPGKSGKELIAPVIREKIEYTIIW